MQFFELEGFGVAHFSHRNMIDLLKLGIWTPD